MADEQEWNWNTRNYECILYSDRKIQKPTSKGCGHYIKYRKIQAITSLIISKFCLFRRDLKIVTFTFSIVLLWNIYRPHSGGMGKAMFWQASVCLFMGEGVPTLNRGYIPWPGGGTYLGQWHLPWSKIGLPPQEIEQHSEYLLRGGRYASCIHAGGLSCLWIFLAVWVKTWKMYVIFSEASYTQSESWR